MKKKNSRKILLLAGGTSSEFDVSILARDNCFKALQGYEDIKLLTLSKEHNLWNFLNEIKTTNPSIVLNCIYGRFGEDGTLQNLLNQLKIPYTNSGMFASFIGWDKILTKKILGNKYFDFANDKIIDLNNLAEINKFPTPFVIKPNKGGSSIDTFIINDIKDLNIDLIKSRLKIHKQFLIEEYIAGDELSCTALFNKTLEVTRLISKNNSLYDYKAKYHKNNIIHELPAKIPLIIRTEILQQTTLAYKILACRGIVRCDFRYDHKNNRLVMLEINTNPGMTNTSLAPEQAKFVGISLKELLISLIDKAAFD